MCLKRNYKKNSTEILNKLKTKGFQASTISTNDFSTLYTTLPHNMIRNQLVDLIENTFRREEALYLACNEEHAFFASEEHKKYHLWSCQKVTDALIYLLDNIYIILNAKKPAPGKDIKIVEKNGNVKV